MKQTKTALAIQELVAKVKYQSKICHFPSLVYFSNKSYKKHSTPIPPKFSLFGAFQKSYSSQPTEPGKTASPRPKTTIKTIRKLYLKREPITVLTAHDYSSALLTDKAGIEICLVGDSLAMVALGYDTTTPITIEEMIHHCRAVARGAKSPFLIADMPFGSYETSPVDAVKNAIRIIKDGNMEAIKLEGGKEFTETIKKITSIGIPVMGHLGLTPQRQTSLGGYRIQGNTAIKARRLLEDAKSVQEAGCFALVLEAVPEIVAKYITKNLDIPTIGIGAGSSTSGQVLVQLDMLGIFDRFIPRFCKRYASLGTTILEAMKTYREEVKNRKFPAEANCYPMPEGELEKFLKDVKDDDLRKSKII
ncbi:hypothetical protein G9A89_019833 [Geosiphon pyriformis]|nr:hypothetical protein G9A89_019833 [Geosiphon pyriformis]